MHKSNKYKLINKSYHKTNNNLKKLNHTIKSYLTIKVKINYKIQTKTQQT